MPNECSVCASKRTNRTTTHRYLGCTGSCFRRFMSMYNGENKTKKMQVQYFLFCDEKMNMFQGCMKMNDKWVQRRWLKWSSKQFKWFELWSGRGRCQVVAAAATCGVTLITFASTSSKVKAISWKTVQETPNVAPHAAIIGSSGLWVGRRASSIGSSRLSRRLDPVVWSNLILRRNLHQGSEPRLWIV